MADQPQLSWFELTRRTGYPIEAFQFVREGLQHTVGLVHKIEDEEAIPAREDDHHVSGQQLCFGLREYAMDRYGMLAGTVLERWRIRRTSDFGTIVFAMIEAGLMRKSDEDTPADFDGVYEFDEAFRFDELSLTD